MVLKPILNKHNTSDMQGRNFFILLLFACFLLCSNEAIAQKLTTNEDGEKIIVYSDGSWRYFDENDAVDVEEVEAAQIEEEKKKKKTKKKKRSKKKKSKKPKKSKGKKSKKSKRKKNKGKSPLDPAVEAAAKNEAIRRADLAAAREEEAKLEVEEVVFKRIFLEEELAEAYQNVDMTHEDVAVIEAKLKKAKAEEKASKSKLQKVGDRAKKMEKMIEMPKAKRDKLLAKMDGTSKKKKKGNKNKVANRGDKDIETGGSSRIPSWGKRKLVAYNSQNDVMLNPPSKDCNLSFDGVDEFTGTRRKDVAKQLFFTYTPSRFKPYFKGRNYITCHGFLSKISNGGIILNLEFVILTEQAVREFGALEMGSVLTVRGINGNRISLTNKKNATGMANSLDKTTTYKAQYQINSGDVKSLQKMEVDKIRVIWGTGYEDYEVYEVDFLIDQFKCLK